MLVCVVGRSNKTIRPAKIRASNICFNRKVRLAGLRQLNVPLICTTHAHAPSLSLSPSHSRTVVACVHALTHSPSYVFVRSPIAIFHEFFATSGENSETVKLTSNIQFLASWELIRTRMPAGCARRLLISRIRLRAAKLHLFSAYLKIVKKLKARQLFSSLT